MSQTLSLAQRNRIQKLEEKQNNLLEQIKDIKAKPVRSKSGTRTKSDKITELKQRFDVLKVHAELQGIAKPTEVAKLMDKHYDAKELGISLLGSIIDKLVHTRKSTDNFKQILSNEKVLELINAALDVVKPGTKHYTDKEVDKIIKEYGTNITSIQKDVREAIVKRDAGQPFEGSLAYTEADKGESKDLATEMVAEKK